MTDSMQGMLFPEQDLIDEPGDRRTVINARCQLLMSGDDRIVMVLGVVLAHYRDGDRVPVGYPAGRSRLKPSRIRAIEQLKAEGHSNRAIAARMGVDEKVIRKVLILRHAPAMLPTPSRFLQGIDPLQGKVRVSDAESPGFTRTWLSEAFTANPRVATTP